MIWYPSDVSGYGLADGEIAIGVIGGTPPYNYIWSNGETTPTISDLLAGTYSVSLTDADGCSIETTATIASPSLLEVLMQNVEGDIDGEGTGLIMVEIIGGVPPYMYSWEDADGNVISTDKNPSGLSANSYRLFVTDANGNVAESDWIEAEMLVNTVNLTLSSLISLSPNPAQGEINLEIKDINNDAQVIVIDVRGREVYRQKIKEGNNRMDVNFLAEGVYFFRIQAGEQSVVEKVLLSK